MAHPYRCDRYIWCLHNAADGVDNNCLSDEHFNTTYQDNIRHTDVCVSKENSPCVQLQKLHQSSFLSAYKRTWPLLTRSVKQLKELTTQNRNVRYVPQLFTMKVWLALQPVGVSVCLCLSVCLSVYMSVSLSVHMSTCKCVYQFSVVKNESNIWNHNIWHTSSCYEWLRQVSLWANMVTANHTQVEHI